MQFKIAGVSESSERQASGATWGIGFSGCGDSLAVRTEVIAMRLRPISITFTLRKTRTSWSLTIRVSLNR